MRVDLHCTILSCFPRENFSHLSISVSGCFFDDTAVSAKLPVVSHNQCMLVRTADPQQSMEQFLIFYSVVRTVEGTIGTVGNVAVIITCSRFRKPKSNCHVIIMYLAVSDILACCLGEWSATEDLNEWQQCMGNSPQRKLAFSLSGMCHFAVQAQRRGRWCSISSSGGCCAAAEQDADRDSLPGCFAYIFSFIGMQFNLHVVHGSGQVGSQFTLPSLSFLYILIRSKSTQQNEHFV